MSQPLWVCPCSWRVCFPSLCCSGSRLLCLELSEAGPGFQALPRSKPLRFRSGTPQRYTLVGLQFVPFPGPSHSGDQVFGKQDSCDLLPLLSLPLDFLGVQPVHLLRRMSTV